MGRRVLPRGWRDFGLQLSIWFGFYFTYLAVRHLTDRDPTKAIVNGLRVISFEQHVSHHLFELSVERVADSSQFLLTASAWTYWNSEFTVIGLTLLWVYLRRHETFSRFRNTILLANLIGLIGFWLVPTAPPWMFPDKGFVAGVNHSSALLQTFGNSYAAMPSLHAADALIVGFFLVSTSRTIWAKALWALWPGLGLVLRDRDREPLRRRRARRDHGRGRLAAGHRPASATPRAPARAWPGHRKPAIVGHSRIAMVEMNSTPVLRRVKHSYTTGARSLAGRSVTRLARTGVTPNVLTATGVSLCLLAAVLVPFEDRANALLVYWLAAAIFVVGSLLDILDGALARVGGKSTPFGAFIDSTTDRVGEGAMLARDCARLRAPRRRGWAVVVAVGRSSARSSSRTRAPAPRPSACGQRRPRLTRRAGRPDHRGARLRAVGRTAVGDRRARRDRRG